MTVAPISIRLEAAADRGHGITFLSRHDRDRVSWAQLHEEARAVAARLQARGIVPGDHICLLGPTSRPLVTALQACWQAGACAIVLPLPMRMGSLEEFVAQTRDRVRRADTRLVCIDPELRPFYEPGPDDPPLVELDALMTGAAVDAERFERPVDDLDRLVVLQFTSGSTSEPKGVMLPGHVVGANLDAIQVATGLDVDEDVVVSWLPLYHDMGLIGLLTTSMTFGCELALASPQDFLAHPGNWMEWLSAFKATATAGPNFSYVLATRALGRAGNLDLSRMRIALNGAEPIDPVAVESFVAAASKHGFRPGAEFCAFGMAEVAIAGTFPPPMRGMVCDLVDRRALEHEQVAKPAESPADARRLPLLGTPVPGLEVRVCNPVTGAALGEREVGELEIRGTSVTPGYYRRPDLTEASFHDGWFRTGDLAYLVDGELVLCGRIKDVIIIGGRNIFPEDIERAVGVVEGVRTGNVIAFGVDHRGKEAVVVVAEVRDRGEADRVRKAVNHRVLEVAGVPVRDVVLVPPGTLPKTSSGKLQRALCRQRYLDDELAL